MLKGLGQRGSGRMGTLRMDHTEGLLSIEALETMA
jgi:hypothetical protein